MTGPVVAPLVGVGFGPAGIALSVCLSDEERQGRADLVCREGDAVFLEKAATASWQPGMVLPGTDIQHHFLRDFATPRDADSRFTFVKFLLDKDRFYPFTLRGGYVTREEWSQYCEWVAAQVTSQVRFNHSVEATTPVHDASGTLVALDVHSTSTVTGEQHVIRTSRLVLATGHRPRLPQEFRGFDSSRVFHSTEFGARMAALESPLRRVAVIGGGQNAGEVLLHLHATTDSELFSVVRNSGFRLYDLGHFANQAYWPDETDYVHGLQPGQRQRVFDEQHRTNYAAVDPDVSTGLYNTWYDEGVRGVRRLHMLKRTRVAAAESVGDEVRLTLKEVNTGEVSHLLVDAVVLCTGFEEPAVPREIEGLGEHLTLEADGALRVDRDFRTPLRQAADVHVYLHGMSERRHGIASATSFSLLAHRSGEIVESMRQARRLAAAPLDVAMPSSPTEPLVPDTTTALSPSERDTLHARL